MEDEKSPEKLGSSGSETREPLSASIRDPLELGLVVGQLRAEITSHKESIATLQDNSNTIGSILNRTSIFGAVVVVIGAIAAFFGYDNLASVKQEVQKSLESKFQAEQMEILLTYREQVRQMTESNVKLSSILAQAQSLPDVAKLAMIANKIDVITTEIEADNTPKCIDSGASPGLYVVTYTLQGQAQYSLTEVIAMSPRVGDHGFNVKTLSPFATSGTGPHIASTIYSMKLVGTASVLSVELTCFEGVQNNRKFDVTITKIKN